MKKRPISFLLSIFLILTFLVLPENQSVHAANTMKVGDYVQFGQYLGKPILWRVINLDSDGSPMLFSEKILSIKPFDAAESGTYNVEGNNPYSSDILRQKFGSNKWENSNLREWLNSSDTKVTYSTQAPAKPAVQKNAYADESGFLSNFNEAERNAIKPVTHKSILADIDKQGRDGGSEIHPYNENTAYSVQNFDNAYYKNVTDKVYLLDIKELHDYVFKRGYEYFRKPTTEAVTSSEYKYNVLSPENNWYYWLRTPCADFTSYVRHVDTDDFIYSSNAAFYSGGVAPALNLKSAAYKAGKGTASDPYIPDDGSSADQLYSYAYSSVAAAQNIKSQKAINNARRALASLNNTAASWAIGEFSKQLDQLQQPILVKIVDSINQAQSSLKQSDINIAKTTLDPDLLPEWRNSYSTAVDLIQQKLMQKAVSAVDKAVNTRQSSDITAANVVLDEIKTAADSSISAWSEVMKKQLSDNLAPAKPGSSSSVMKLGDYVQFGKYLGQPILWRVINLDSDGSPMLLSEKILTVRPYDAAESGKDAQYGSNPYTTNSFRQAFGSNNWETSNLREWLNSSDAKVRYSTQPPTKTAVNQNSYAEEAGFLSSFSEIERNAIKPVTHKAILTDVDKSSKDDGTAKDHTYNENIGDWVQNYDDVYYKNVTDTVSILDIKELHDYVYNRGFEYIKKPSQQAVSSSEFKQSNFTPNNYWFYWLRVPCTDDANGVRHIDSDGFVFSSNATYFDGGVVPTLTLKAGTFASGSGTIDNPYIPDNGASADKLYTTAFTAVQNAEASKTQSSINTARNAVAALKGTEAGWAIAGFSAKLDAVQQPILDNINSAVKKAQASLKQADINAARALIGSELPAEYKVNFTFMLDTVQAQLKSNAIAAHNKAVQSGSQSDLTYANALIADLQTSTDSSIVQWAANIKGQSGIIQEVVTFKDKNLEQAIRTSVNKLNGDIYKSDIEKLTVLDASGKGISDISGIENLTNLKDLNLDKNYITDLSPLKSLSSLVTVSLDSNQISDVSPLKSLANLTILVLNNNHVADVTTLKGLSKLERLFLSFTDVTNISIVNSLPNLTWLYVEGTKVSDITPLKGLTRFTNLNLWHTLVRDSDVIELKKELPNCSFYNQ